MDNKFAVFIISHGRPSISMTEKKLIDGGYTGKIIYIIDDLDETKDEYFKNHQNVFMFNKMFSANQCDKMINKTNYKATLFVRNQTFKIAKELMLDYFLVLDDDYYYFGHRGHSGAKKTKRLDEIFNIFIEFLKNTNVKCVAFSQDGDHIGGWTGSDMMKRKVMNSFFCATNRPFKYYGLMNDDVNAYLKNGQVGDLFFTYMGFQLDQIDTQQLGGGLTESYNQSGTYVKSFFSVMIAPSCVSIRCMGEKFNRLHHSIKWQQAAPCIINGKNKKI